jgi:hypothetical protein
MLHATDATLYLPISDPLLDRVLDERRPLPEALAGLAVPQLAALVVVQCVGAGTVSAPGRMLAEMISLGNRWERQAGLAEFASQTLAALDRDRLRAGRQRLPELAIVLLEPGDLDERTYLTAEGEWNSAFHARYREKLARTLTRAGGVRGESRLLTPQQGRIFREAEAQTDEDLHVQGYGGAGKSHLITTLVGMLVAGGAAVALVAERKGQLDELVARIGQVEGVRPLTFGTLMDEVVPPDLTQPGHRRMRRRDRSRATMSDENLARHLGIHPAGELSAVAIVRIVRGTVSAFCRGEAAEIDAVHIPMSAPPLDPATRLLVLHHATELWKAITGASAADFSPPVRDYHRIKWAALCGWKLPARYTHVLMDECHDLPRPLLQIVEHGRQTVITLGDEYQNLQARPQYRSGDVRHRALTVSVRSGPLIEGIVNPIIAAHPGRTKLPFRGSPFTRLEVLYYDRAELPAEPVVVLVHDEWGLFEWAQRLAEKGEFALLSSADMLNMFVSDCVELHRHGTRPRHAALFRFASWEAVAARHSDNPGFARIDRMLARGYTAMDWARTLERACGGPRGYQLARVEDVRNKEFATVMLAQDVIDWAWRTRQSARAEAGSAIYVAVTRARRRLYLPQRLKAWIEDLQTD